MSLRTAMPRAEHVLISVICYQSQLDFIAMV